MARRLIGEIHCTVCTLQFGEIFEILQGTRIRSMVLTTITTFYWILTCVLIVTKLLAFVTPLDKEPVKDSAGANTDEDMITV